ncbi:MAG: aldehyde dehydrogenase family protein [Xanthomonadales bacterium]|nr:aldehyde dehydrogenase family protein [Gammaproteobacteria bacterium]MBT8051492.1 aldehyde dehydrogenase family protein [Gammaproteobacteria bacterium]MBT8056453.1 aldehyde dehydrogenase family protein [Gammaproteobacteria bacterium]NNL03947.1 aldehyde dehydrogenase family protein [Xanthomonadales bacterium]
MEVRDLFESMDYGSAPESPDRARQWLDKRKGILDHFIGGRWVTPAGGEYFPTHNPASGELLATVADGNEADVNRAVAAAADALEGWVAIGGHGRARYLYALARHIQKHARLFSVLESLDNGKPIRESRDVDIPLVARHFYHHAGWAQVMRERLSSYRPIGVVGQIIPWNFPLLMLAWKVAPALAMGNTVVLKPAEYTPTTAVLFAELCEEIGLPRGVFNVVLGDHKAGEALVQHQEVGKVAFTGSTEVGRILRRATAGTGKKLTLELGGKSPFVVFDDTDIDSAVEGLVDAIWFNQGQVCCAGSRLLVQESVAERLHEKIRRRMERLVLGDPLDKSIDIGSLVDPTQLERVRSLVETGVEEGGELWQPDCKVPRGGSYYPPTLITEVAPSATLAQEEIFGPVLVSSTFRTPAEAVALANNSRYGLAASVWTENINLALDVAPKLKAGTVWINCTNQFDAASGFGGYRESGFGREGGIEGIYEYVKPFWESRLSKEPVQQLPRFVPAEDNSDPGGPSIDRTPKLYIGGKQCRPDGGYSNAAYDAHGEVIAEVPAGNRKDIRNAVEAARKAEGWSSMTAHGRAQILYFLAENLSARTDEFVGRIVSLSGKADDAARTEFELCIQRIWHYAAMADKYDSYVHATPFRNVTLAMKEPLGVIGIVAPEEAGLLGFVSTAMPALAMGNRVVVVPSQHYALLATDFYQVLDTSDVPGGVINIVTGDQDVLADTLARHLDIEGLWYWGSRSGSRMIEEAAAESMKRTWVNYGLHHDWFDAEQGQGESFLRRAVEIKNIWIPYGE